MMQKGATPINDVQNVEVDALHKKMIPFLNHAAMFC